VSVASVVGVQRWPATAQMSDASAMYRGYASHTLLDVDEHAMRALEFDVVLERLSASAATPYGVERALAVMPSIDRDEVARRQALTDEAVALLDNAAEPPLDGIPDIRVAVERAERGGVLSVRELFDVAAAIEGGLRARNAMAEQGAAPALRAIADAVDPALGVAADEIRRAVDDEGAGLRDTASPRLRSLRAELRAGMRRAEQAMQRLVQSSTLRPHLQETFVTERAGRPVLAVKLASRGSVPGIVHDASGSGQTLFVEPFEVVELNNEQSETAAEEREEVARILAELSQSVGTRSDALTALVEAVGELDLAVARGALSRGWRGTRIERGDDVRLVGVRHPLLDPGTVVPVDLELDRLRAVVISGPNTGGKTVALKTVGLAALLYQAGLRVPADEAELPVFDDVLVEIGDQQSIAMSLSSFAAHVRNLIEILGAATAHSLVLLDEPASGTDPVEGAALAQALLERLAQQARLTIATTHYAELKEWASAADDATNAATAIDPVTHEPRYRLTLGRAGTSHALETAERLGLDPAVVERAQAAIEPARRRISTLLAEAEAAERAAEDERARARDERRNAESALRDTRSREAQLVAEIERVRDGAAAERERALADVRAELTDTRAQLESLRAEIREARRLQRRVERSAAPDAERARDRRLGAASEHSRRAEEQLQRLDAPVRAPAPLAVGDPVVAPGIGVRGTIVEIQGTEAEVVGATGQRVRIALDRLQPSADRATPEGPAVRLRATVPSDLRDELDVRGRTAQEAREAVRSLVDDASIGGLRSVRIVHGRGTGALRDAVRDELRRHQLVGEIASESADGATVARLAE
jgi:DNA mismatch repair protein MutS2